MKDKICFMTDMIVQQIGNSGARMVANKLGIPESVARMSRKGRFGRLKSCLLLVLGLPLLFLLLIFAYRAYSQSTIRYDSQITSPEGIESLEKVTIGGVEQWILIRGENSSNPVLLWLHGGPGSTSMPLASKHDSELIKEFVVVHWDQRGAGKSYAPDLPKSSMTVDQFVSDAVELSTLLTERFDRPKIYLVGHSWGTTVGILALHKQPDLFQAYIGIAQFVSSEGHAIGYQWALEQAIQQDNQSAREALEGIGPPPWTTIQEYDVYATSVDAFGGIGRNYTTFDYLSESALSPDYSVRDLLNYQRAQIFSVTTVVENGEFGNVDLFRQAVDVDVPVHFFQGRYDYSTPGEVVERYYDLIDAPQKSLIWFEDSAHFPHLEEPEKFTTELLSVLR